MDLFPQRGFWGILNNVWSGYAWIEAIGKWFCCNPCEPHFTYPISSEAWPSPIVRPRKPNPRHQRIVIRVRPQFQRRVRLFVVYGFLSCTASLNWLREGDNSERNSERPNVLHNNEHRDNFFHRDIEGETTLFVLRLDDTRWECATIRRNPSALLSLSMEETVLWRFPLISNRPLYNCGQVYHSTPRPLINRIVSTLHLQAKSSKQGEYIW